MTIKIRIDLSREHRTFPPEEMADVEVCLYERAECTCKMQIE